MGNSFSHPPHVAAWSRVSVLPVYASISEEQETSVLGNWPHYHKPPSCKYENGFIWIDWVIFTLDKTCMHCFICVYPGWVLKIFNDLYVSWNALCMTGSGVICFVCKNLFAMCKYTHFSTGQYKNCSWSTNFLQNTRCARRSRCYLVRWWEVQQLEW
jgi:hypothetical protein